MAYDPHTAYQPPGRPYYAQRQQASVQNAYGHDGGRQEQYGGYTNGYEQDHNQGYGQQQYGAQRDYDQVHDQQNEQYNQYGESNGYGQNKGRDEEQKYDDGYRDGYRRPGRQRRAPQQHADRPYDPRYQQRGGRSGPQPNGRHPPQRAQQPVDQDYEQRAPTNQQGYQTQSNNRQGPADSRNGYHQNGNQQRQQSPRNGMHQAGQQAVPPANDQRYQQDPRDAGPKRQDHDRQPASPALQPRAPIQGVALGVDPPPQQPSGPKKLTMAEWKAQEKAKLHEAKLPEVIPQDNAFPTFPGMEKKPKKSDRTGGTSAMSNRSSEDPPRPSESSSRPGEPLQPGQRPVASRSNSHQNGELSIPSSSQPAEARPGLDRKPYSFEPSRDESLPQHEAQQKHSLDSRTSDQRPRHPAGSEPNMNQRQAQMQPMAYQQQQSGQRRPAQLQSSRSSPDDMQRTRMHPVQQQFPRNNGNAPVQSYNNGPRNFANQHAGPDSFANRPSTAQDTPGRRPGCMQSLPLHQLSRSQTAPNDNGDAAWQPPPKAYTPAPMSNNQKSLGDVHAGYGAEPLTPAKSREEEIESEMPDFDSAAPSQTSMLHKRGQNAGRNATHVLMGAPTPMAQHQAMAPLHNHPRRPQEQEHLRQTPSTGNGGFEFGVPQSRPPPQQYQYEDPRQEPRQRQFSGDSGYGNGAVQAPPRPSYVDQAPRVSMDETYQVPYRQGPPQQGRPPQSQRSGSNGLPPRMRQQQRPFMGRNYSGATIQTTFSEPVMQRIGSGTPTRSGMAQPPMSASINNVPLSPHGSSPQDRAHNPDALPAHPTPVRPGLIQGGAPQPSKPPPVRNYSQQSASSPSQAREPCFDSAKPVTVAELEQFRVAADANSGSPKTQFAYAKKLVEASTVLASDDGRADPKTQAKNRERYITDAHKRIKKLVSQGYPEAQFYLADCYGQGSLGLEPDPKEAFNLYQAAAKAGHAAAAYRTAVCCEMGPDDGGGTRKDFAKAVQWYRRAAVLGDAAAMYKVGMISLKGLLGEKRNLADASNWLKRGAERADKDNPHALHTLATLHEASNTDPEVRSKIAIDEAYALSLFQQAAGLGFKTSQFRLGQAYEYGSLGLTIDNRASISWYSKAAAQGEHQAELALSGWYLTGAEGILGQNDTEAYLWARKAASSEPPLAKAMFAMGYFSEQGIGCAANIDEAKRWYGRAASYKFPKAMERLEELRRSGKAKPAAVNGKLTRKDQKRDEAECVVM